MTADRRRLAELALGRIFRLGSRPTQPGDIEEYERCRRIIMDAAADEAGTLPSGWTAWPPDRGHR